MTRIYTTGFETGDKGDLYVESNSSLVTCVGTTGSYSPKTGSFMLRIVNNGEAQVGPSISTTNLFGHVAFLHSNTTVDKIFSVADNTGAELCLLRVTASGNLQAYRGDASSLLQASTGTISTNVWYHLEFNCYINDTSGTFQLKVDGQNWINFSGDTKPSTPDVISVFTLYGGNGASSLCFYDDIALNDSLGTGTSSVTSFPGQVRLFPIFPNGVGDVTGLNVSGSATNWGAVDEYPSSSAEYVWSISSGTYDLYNMQDVSIPTGTVISNLIAVSNATYDSGAGMINNVIKSSGIEVFGIPQTLSSAYRPYQFQIEKDPNGNITWTETSINDIQAGPKAA